MGRGWWCRLRWDRYCGWVPPAPRDSCLAPTGSHPGPPGAPPPPRQSRRRAPPNYGPPTRPELRPTVPWQARELRCQPTPKWDAARMLRWGPPLRHPRLLLLGGGPEAAVQGGKGHQAAPPWRWDIRRRREAHRAREVLAGRHLAAYEVDRWLRPPLRRRRHGRLLRRRRRHVPHHHAASRIADTRRGAGSWHGTHTHMPSWRAGQRQAVQSRHRRRHPRPLRDRVGLRDHRRCYLRHCRFRGRLRRRRPNCLAWTDPLHATGGPPPPPPK